MAASKTQAADAPEAHVVDAPKTQVVDASETQMVDAPKTQVVDASETQVVWRSCPTIGHNFLDLVERERVIVH